MERGKVFSHLEPPFTIGREISNEIALNDESVSRYHAKIQADNERIIYGGLAERVLKEEHRIFPLAIRWFAEGRLEVRAGQVLLDGEVRPEQGLATTPVPADTD